MKLSQFKFKLPEELIAQYPSKNRDECRLMVLDVKKGKIEHRIFKEILDYFDEVYGTDIVPMKPRKESFMSVIGNLEPSECVMIGDNLKVDIEVPYELGFNVYHLNKFGTSKYPTIRKIEELKERL